MTYIVRVVTVGIDKLNSDEFVKACNAFPLNEMLLKAAIINPATGLVYVFFQGPRIDKSNYGSAS